MARWSAGHADEDVPIALGKEFMAFNARLLFRDVGPCLIKFQTVDPNADHHPIMQLGTALADLKRKPTDRLAVDASEASGCSHADALTERSDDLDLLVTRKDMHGPDP
jgi:hypothetical protein